MIINEEIKCIVNKSWGDAVDVWLIRRSPDGKTYSAVIKEGLIDWVLVMDGTSPETPLLKSNMIYWQEIVNALTKETTPIEEKEVKAELNATKYHLEDMRKLVFKNK